MSHFSMPTSGPLDPALAAEYIGDRHVILSVSGGKDSTASGLYLKELGIEFTAVHQDTGWEHPHTVQHVRSELAALFGGVTVLRAEPTLTPEQEEQAGRLEELAGVEHSAMLRTIVKKGMFPSRQRRFCTEELKVFPMAAYLDSLEDEPINVIGIRADESAQRATQPLWDWNKTFDCEVWRPLLDWTEQDVIAIHQRHGVKPNPLYLRAGVSRVGCWPCIFARKGEIRRIAEMDGPRIELMEELERVVGEAAMARGNQTNPPSWFQARTGRAGNCWPIRRVVAWAFTKFRKTEENEPFAPDYAAQGCMRWGMCDHSDKPLPARSKTTYHRLVCEVCGGGHAARRRHKRTCSDACRKALSRGSEGVKPKRRRRGRSWGRWQATGVDGGRMPAQVVERDDQAAGEIQ